MTLQLLHSEFPYIWGNLDFLFYQCAWLQLWRYRHSRSMSSFSGRRATEGQGKANPIFKECVGLVAETVAESMSLIFSNKTFLSFQVLTMFNAYFLTARGIKGTSTQRLLFFNFISMSGSYNGEELSTFPTGTQTGYRHSQSLLGTALCNTIFVFF
jgi:hypothetical protein